MKKIVCGIAGILATISAANAVDTAEIKAACQSSDKTLWVERNQVCIPRNPCDNPNFEQYCERNFSKVATQKEWAEKLVNFYAETRNLDCSAIPSKNKIGKDYVICMGNDVMVFEFKNINALKPHFCPDVGSDNPGLALEFCDYIAGGNPIGGGVCRMASAYEYSDGLSTYSCETDKNTCERISKYIAAVYLPESDNVGEAFYGQTIHFDGEKSRVSGACILRANFD